MTDRLAFLEWMKAIGITLIVYGHVTGAAPLVAIAPIYSKQLGVALFVFAAGYSLARENRDRWHAAYNRLFEMYLFGLACALLWTVVSALTVGKVTRSNYLPFVLGLNVLENAFPANPTTWYIGTYLHLVVIWALGLHRVRITGPILACGVVAEITIRAILVPLAGGYVAYMLLPNWTTALLLGLWYGQRRLTTPSISASMALAGLTIGLAVWVGVWTALPLEATFPFMQLRNVNPVVGAAVVSAAASFLYAAIPWLVFGAVAFRPAPRVVGFLARNTVILFIAHMPLYYVLLQPAREAIPDPGMRAVFMMAVCLFGLAGASEGLRRLVRPRALRDRLFTWATSIHAKRFAVADPRC